MLSKNARLAQCRRLWVAIEKASRGAMLSDANMIMWRIKDDMYPRMRSQCPACQYSHDMHLRQIARDQPIVHNCGSNCLINWGDESGCVAYGSPYLRSDFKKIVELIDKSIEENDARSTRRNRPVVRCDIW